MSWTAEQVEENYYVRPGQASTRVFWIAYPDDVGIGSYGHEKDRIERAYGRGRTRKEALEAAAGRGGGWRG